MTMQITFSIGTYARNRFDLKNIISLIARLTQIAFIVILFTATSPNLVYIGIGLGLSAVVTVGGDIFLWRRLLPELRINLRSFDPASFKMILGTGLWMFVYQVGAILFLNLDMLIANATLGLSLAGMYGALLVIPKNLRVLSSAVGGVWGPTIFSRYGRSDFIGMDRVVRISSKLVGLTLALPVGYLVGVSGQFLALWLGPEFEALTWVLIVMVFHLSFNLITSPFLNVQLSLNKVRLPALVYVSFGLLYGLLAYFMAQKFGPLGIVATGAVLQTLKNFLIMPIYSARIMGYPWWHYVTRLMGIILWTLGTAIMAQLMLRIIPLTSFLNLLLNGGIVTLVYALAVFVVGLTREEREQGMRLLRRIGEQSISFVQQYID